LPFAYSGLVAAVAPNVTGVGFTAAFVVNVVEYYEQGVSVFKGVVRRAKELFKRL